MKSTRKRTRPGWQQLGSGVAGKWLHHSSGWIVRHCGHPTALWPYYCVSPTGLQLLAENGHGFRTLELALYPSLGKLPEPESTHEFF